MAAVGTSAFPRYRLIRTIWSERRKVARDLAAVLRAK